MKTTRITLFLILTSGLFAQVVWSQSTIPAPEQQIQAAVSPAPENMQENAEVLGYNDQGELIILREGSNELVCLADNPSDGRFHTACYHTDLEPFMKRGRELRSEGLNADEIRNIRQSEIEEGILPMPQKPMALYSLSGSEEAWNFSTHALRSASPLYVIYIPYATVESTGLSTSPASEGAPWLMNAGKPWAHIMVGTGRQLGEDVSSDN